MMGTLTKAIFYSLKSEPLKTIEKKRPIAKDFNLKKIFLKVPYRANA